MATTNADRVGQALKALNKGLNPYAERELRAHFGDDWLVRVNEGLRDHQKLGEGDNGEVSWDTQSLLIVMWNEWNTVFRDTLGHDERSIVSELRGVRNRWAHQETFSGDDAYRALDSIQRLLTGVSAAPEAREVDKVKTDLLRVRFQEQARHESRKAAVAAIEGDPKGGLKPWRDVITPHPDVASGRYQQAEFAADLWQVFRGEGASEYLDPVEFYRRTHLTDGLRDLLRNGLRRLIADDGDPVVELQTNFGGGKTHSLLALYHLVGGRPASELAGMEELLKDEGIDNLPEGIRRVVLVGNKISPGRPDQKADGTKVHTLWGEIAWQLGGSEAYERIADDDRRATNPGELLHDLLNEYGPALILIDEWVAYARQLHDTPDLPGGTFDTQFTFAQTLSEAAKSAAHTLLVVSVPSSDIELGGRRGKDALERLKNGLGRVEAPWRPASAEESFEIVRRRLFQGFDDPTLYAARDAVVKSFSNMYRQQASEFPSQCREAAYEKRLRDSYPIHPELFDRLFTDWSALDKFQRTRGVLRLMASVIHELWERQDKSLVILPASVPINAPAVQSELTRYLEDGWVAVLEKDVDGPNSLPLHLDRDHPNLGRYSACRRVARTVYMGSAPTLHGAHCGIEDPNVRLGCVQPGETVATFGDALRRLSDKATYLYEDRERYWYSTQANVTQLARERAGQFKDDQVWEEIRLRVRDDVKARSDFARVHAFPSSPGDVLDIRETRLVVLGPDAPHSKAHDASAARNAVASILTTRGSTPRDYPNTLVFLAPDKTRLDELTDAARQFLAWRTIDEEHEILNLDPQQRRQAQTHRAHADSTARARIPEAFCWLLVPTSNLPGEAEAESKEVVKWLEYRLQGEDLVARAARKLKIEELMITDLGAIRLRMDLDRVPLWRGDHVRLEQLAEDFARYLYLPKLRDSEVLVGAVQDGIALIDWSPSTFAYAEAFDDSMKAYRGVKAGQGGAVILNANTVIIKPEIAEVHLATVTPGNGTQGPGTNAGPEGESESGEDTTEGNDTVGAVLLKRFYGTVDLDSSKLTTSVKQVADEVVQHLTAQMGSEVRVSLEIEAKVESGLPEKIVRDVTENCATLGFREHGFEEA